jgi:hypothetical protein
MFYSQWQKEGWIIDGVWDVLLTAKGGPNYGGGVESIGGTCGGSGVQRLHQIKLIKGYLTSHYNYFQIIVSQHHFPPKLDFY